jgi:hypothetical protein
MRRITDVVKWGGGRAGRSATGERFVSDSGRSAGWARVVARSSIAGAISGAAEAVRG